MVDAAARRSPPGEHNGTGTRWHWQFTGPARIGRDRDVRPFEAKVPLAPANLNSKVPWQLTHR